MASKSQVSIVFVVNVDWFFVSHRLPLALIALSRSYKVFLVTKDTGHFGELTKFGISCIDLIIDRGGGNPIREIIGFLRLCRIYQKLKPDLLHHITLKQSIYGTIAAVLFTRQSKIINAVTGLGYAFTDGRRPLSNYVAKLLMKLAFSRKKANFIFQNIDDLEIYAKMGFLTFSNNIVIKGAGVDEKIFTPIFRQSIANQPVKIVLVARMLKDKGIMEFIYAATILKKQYNKKAVFILVGGLDKDNPSAIDSQELQNYIDDEYLRWEGHVSDVRSVYEAADIACLPSYREGLPKSLVEAMAMECPIVTTDAPGCRACVDDGFNGYLVPVKDYRMLANRISMLIDNESLRLQMGKNSRLKMISEMSLDKVIEKTFRFYGY
jgi:glycosyltransferase involved in cell wall biosynthesis